jgi:hypothetical protein
LLSAADTRFGVWRALLGPDARTATPALLKEKLLELRDDAGLWAVLLNRGGHFAAAIFACGPALPKPDPRAVPGSSATLFHPIAHKTFHRYTVRYACFFTLVADPSTAANGKTYSTKRQVLAILQQGCKQTATELGKAAPNCLN